MKTIERLLQEYRIRFRDTEKIKEEGYPWEDEFLTALIPLNSGKRDSFMTEHRIENENGLVYMKNENNQMAWATADLKEKPDKWVVEKNESHPMWEEFKEWFKRDIWQGDMGSYYALDCKYQAEHISHDHILHFTDHQYLTLDQWAEFFLPKVDFSILNDTDVFYLKSQINDYLFTGGNPITKKVKGCVVENRYRFTDRICDKDNVMELREANDIEKEYYYTLYPELGPIKAGDWVAVWDDKDIESLFICKYKNVKNDPDWDNIVKVDITDNVDKQIDEFLKQQTK